MVGFGRFLYKFERIGNSKSELASKSGYTAQEGQDKNINGAKIRQ